MKKTNDLFEKQSVWKLIASMSLPAVVTILVMLIYNMADMFFVGLQHDDIQVAAISISSPLYQVLMAFGTLVGTGACAAIAKSLGAKKEEEVKNLSRMSAILAVVIGVILGAAVLLFLNPLLRLIGVPESDPSLWNHARKYIRFIYIGAPIILFSNSFANIVRAEGAVKESMIGNMIGTVVNIALDPLFILVFRMGVSGAAIATVLGNLASGLYFVIYFMRKPTALSIRPTKECLKPAFALPILTLGFPSAITNLLASFAHTLYNRTMIGYGTEAVTAMGAAGKVSMIIGMISIGVCMGIQPAMGYNYGAGNVRRTGEIMKKTTIVNLVTGTLLTGLCMLFREQIVGLFVHEPGTVELAKKMALISLLVCPFIGIYNLSTSFLQSSGNALSASVLSVLRQGAIYIPMVFLLNWLFRLDGLVFAAPVSDLLAVVIGAVLTVRQFRIFRKSVSRAKTAAQ